MKKESLPLPPVDEFRQPFIEPLGHVTLQAAYLEQNLVRLSALLETPPKHRFQNPIPTEGSVKLNDARFEKRLLAAVKAHHPLGNGAAKKVREAFELRKRRNRFIHDAAEVLYELQADGRLTVAVHARRPNADPAKGEAYLTKVEPHQVASLALDIYETDVTP